jgi:hypothetical protein
MHHLLHLFVRPEILASHRLFERSKDMEITGARYGDYSECGRHSKDRSWIVATAEQAVWAKHYHVGATHLYSDVHVVWT